MLLRIAGALTAPTSSALTCRVEEPSTASKPEVATTPPSETVRPEDENRESNPAPRAPFWLQRVCWTARCCRCPGRSGRWLAERHRRPHRREWAHNLMAGPKQFRGHKVGRSEGRRLRGVAISKRDLRARSVPER